jgi:hypothetical protein
MIVSRLDQRRSRQAGGRNQFFTVREWNDFIVPGMQDRRVRLGDTDRSPSLPRGTQKHKRNTIRSDCHSDCAASAGPDNHIGPVAIELVLRQPDGGIEVVIRQGRIDDFVTVSDEMCRLHTTRNGMPTMEKKNLHDISQYNGTLYPGVYRIEPQVPSFHSQKTQS